MKEQKEKLDEIYEKYMKEQKEKLETNFRSNKEIQKLVQQNTEMKKNIA